MKAQGQTGEIRIAGRTAASLGSWSFNREPRQKRVSVSAEVVELDSFLLRAKPLELSLDALSAARAVESVAVDEDNRRASIVMLW